MPSFSAEQDLLPLSWISQYGYCPRRAALLALEQLWNENEYTAAGRSQHDRVHTARIEHHGTQINLYELAVFSRALGISGKCDCVEAQESPNGVPLPFAAGRFVLYPVEYKHGVVRSESEYQMQLCAQALCLEEMYGAQISHGALFFIDAHRRDEVILTPALREKTKNVTRELAVLAAQSHLPTAEYGPRCKKCSMQELCIPTLKHSAKSYCNTLWKDVMQEEMP